MCSPSGLIFILIASLFYNCFHFSVVVIADTTGAASDSATTAATTAKNTSQGSRHTHDFENVLSHSPPQTHHKGGGVTVESSRSRSSSTSSDGQFIDITRKHKIHYNGIVIDEDNLLEHLKDHELELIFGKSRKKRSVKLVHLTYRTTGTAQATTAEKADVVDNNNLVEQKETEEEEVVVVSNNKFKTATMPTLQRFKRSDNVASEAATTKPALPKRQGGAPQLPVVSVQIIDNEHLVNLKLQQTPKLIDDAFVFIRRYANSSQLIENSHNLVTRLEKCFYHNENSALDLCDDENVRGVFHHNNTDFIIHPLPERFGNKSHIILESDKEIFDTSWKNSTVLNENIQFEPEEAKFNDLNIELPTNENMATMRTTRNTETAHHHHQQHNHTQKSSHNNDNQHHNHHHQLPLNLRFKPRHHHHQQQHHHHHPQHYDTHHTQKLSATTTHHKHHPKFQQEFQHNKRSKRYIPSGSQWPEVPAVLHIETAIFVDNDLYKHMAKNFPKDTSSHLIRFVLAMINGVQLLYHHPSLGKRISFVLKRLEILDKDPPELRRSDDIDIYLSNFCKWQNSWNPPKDSDQFHYDHAVILTGLDLYVMGKNGKKISQVVGLAPVAGMCIPTSSCTINEGKHFESVFVVAHEIGHNLGMRHDTMENSCDPTSHIMSPTLGSGKITWSKCSRSYLNTFLETKQAKCLFDRGKFTQNLDHFAEGILPGERFDANHQCMLKYGKDSTRARSQSLADICRDLHCQRDRYTWTSHPALEGTSCGDNMWCRSGFCVVKRPEVYTSLKQTSGLSKPNYDKTNFLENSKTGGHLLHEYQKPSSSWSAWSEASACDSSCIYGPSKRLGEGSTGYKTYSRKCVDYQGQCNGGDHKFETCVTKQCYSVPIITIEDFAKDVCEKMRKFDNDLTGEGKQIVGNMEESCKVYCKTKTNGTKSRTWTFPDGTTCRSKLYGKDDTSYCIAGKCEKFSCDNSTENYYIIGAQFCKHQQKSDQNSLDNETIRRSSNHYSNQIPATTYNGYRERNDNYNYRSSTNNNNNYYGHGLGVGNERIYAPTTVRSKYENEVAIRSFHGQTSYDNSYKRKGDTYSPWNKYSYHLNDHVPAETSHPKSASLISSVRGENEWIVKSGCHSSCMVKSKGIQVVVNRKTAIKNIQLCTHTVKPCERLQTTTEYADYTCSRYKLKVRGLSGHGTQIAASVEDPDRSCRVGCQDEHLSHRFYLVNGSYGHFPLGTKCSNTDERYCVQGKCLEFGADQIPLQQSHISLALFRSRRSVKNPKDIQHSRSKRSFLYYEPINITETLTQDFINNIVNSIITLEEEQLRDDSLLNDHIEFTNPIHYSMDELKEE